MNVLSHRGYWLEPAEQNSEAAFVRSFRSGFGTETDLRDSNGKLATSHDPPRGDETTFDEFLRLHRQFGERLPLALNVKSCGLHRMVVDALVATSTDDLFFFDMSLPDALGYAETGVPFFTRLSELEPSPLLIEHAAGIWVDCFQRDWTELDALSPWLDAGKRICFVSPELHDRKPIAFWSMLREWSAVNRSDVFICTDRPNEARKWFGIHD